MSAARAALIPPRTLVLAARAGKDGEDDVPLGDVGPPQLGDLWVDRGGRTYDLEDRHYPGVGPAAAARCRSSSAGGTAMACATQGRSSVTIGAASPATPTSISLVRISRWVAKVK
jgi:hypothetical protein